MPANQDPIITADAPGGERERDVAGVPHSAVGPDVLAERRAAAAAHSSTAENCGRPTPVIIRVVHIAPGPTPTLTMSAPASISARVPSAETTLPATTGHLRVEAADRAERLDHPLLVAVRGVDDEAVDARVEELLGLASRPRR